ncbi:hypothetical protein PENTCL1PPCAC_12460, partial [Pristionchus entomophagus]
HREWFRLEQGNFLLKTVEKEESSDTACMEDNERPSKNAPQPLKFTDVLAKLDGNDELLISKFEKRRV